MTPDDFIRAITPYSPPAPNGKHSVIFVALYIFDLFDTNFPGTLIAFGSKYIEAKSLLTNKFILLSLHPRIHPKR